MDGAGDRVAAKGAGLTLPAVDGEIEREVAGIAVGIEKIAQGGAAGGDTFPQNVPNLCQSSIPLRSAEFVRGFHGMDPRLEQGFAGVDVADARDAGRIHQKPFDGTLAGTRAFFE